MTSVMMIAHYKYYRDFIIIVIIIIMITETTGDLDFDKCRHCVRVCVCT